MDFHIVFISQLQTSLGMFNIFLRHVRKIKGGHKVQILRSLNPFKWIYPKSISIFFYFKSNPFNCILY